MKRLLLFTVLTCNLISCSTYNPRIVSFDVDGSYEDCGLFLDKQSKKELLFFAKKNFHPNLKIFDANGLLLDSIALKEAEKAVGRIAKVWMSSKDSIFVFSSASQKYAVLDNRGSLIAVKDFGHHVRDEKGNLYDLYPPFHQYLDLRFSDEVVYTTFWIANIHLSNEENQDKSLLSVSENIRKGYLMYQEPDSMLKTSSFGTSITDFVELNSLSKSIFLPYYKTLNLKGTNFLLTHYSKSIYSLDSDLNVTGHFKIMADELPIASPVPVTGKKTDIAAAEKELDEQMFTNCFVSNLLYCKEKDVFAAIVKTGIPEDDFFAYPFQIQVYDSSFTELLGDYQFDSFSYFPASSFVLKDKLYIEKKSTAYERKEFEVIPL